MNSLCSIFHNFFFFLINMILFSFTYVYVWASPVAQQQKNLPANQEPQEKRVWSLSREDALEEGTETHSSTLAWEIPWTEELGGLQSTRSQSVRHDWSDLACTHVYVYSCGLFSLLYALFCICVANLII